MIRNIFQILNFPKALVVGLAFSTTSYAAPVQAQGIVGTLYAQQIAFDMASVRPSTLRRLRFFSEKARTALADVAKADSMTGTTGEAQADKAARDLRKAIEKLIDAARKAKLDLDQAAAFFAQDLRDNYTGPLPFIVSNEAGELNTGPLFQGIYDARASITAGDDADYLAYVNNLGDEAETGDDATNQPVKTEENVPVAVEADTPNRDPAVQVYWDRLSEKDGKRYIRVVSGDTLATYAAAFYGDSLRYRKIYNANTNVMESPNKLTVGLTIEIPR